MRSGYREGMEYLSLMEVADEKSCFIGETEKGPSGRDVECSKSKLQRDLC